MSCENQCAKDQQGARRVEIGEVGVKSREDLIVDRNRINKLHRRYNLT